MAERNSKKWWAWASAGGAVAFWFIDGIILCNSKGLALWTKALQAELWMAVLPNVIAGLGAVALAYFLFKETDRSQYIKAMRTVRRAIHELRVGPAPVLEPHHAQALLEKIVPAISELYYNKAKPPTTNSDEQLQKVDCLLCPVICSTSSGRCDKCKDIPPSWSVKEI